MVTVATDEKLAEARATLAAAALKSADEPQKAAIALVTSKEYAVVEKLAGEAFTLNPANTDVAYLVSMLARVRGSHTPG